MGGCAVGSLTEPMIQRAMDAATIADREREGGGAPRQRLRKVPMQPQTGPALRGIAGLGVSLGVQLLNPSLWP